MTNDSEKQQQHTERPMIFKYSDYDYRIRMGRVISQNSITWEWSVIVSDWSDAKRMIDMWHDNRKYAAVTVSFEYRGDDL